MSLTFLDKYADTSDTDTYTFSDKAIGDANATRRVFAVVHWYGGTNGASLSSGTFEGISATIHVNTTSGFRGVAIMSAEVPSGTTADVVAVFTNAMASCTIGLFSMLDGAASPTDTI